MKRILISVLALTLCLIVFLGVMPAEVDAASVIMQGDISSSTWNGDNVDYVLYSDGKLVISGVGKMSYLSIAPWENYISAIKTVVIESGVTNVGSYAFQGCINLTSVTLPDTVKNIGSYTFDGCIKLTSITLPENLTTIESGAFRGAGLTSIAIPSGVTKIPYNGFRDCVKLTSVTMPNTVTAIDSSAFYGCTALKSVTIPSSVETMGYDVFRNCTALTSVTIPGSVKEMGGYIFGDCTSLTSATLKSGVLEIDYGTFYGCSKLSKVTIPDTVMKIGSSAFYKCEKLASITIPSSVCEIGEYAFHHCTALTSLALPETVSIERGLCYGCTSLTSVTIPNGATSIGSSAFSGCVALKEINVPKSVTSIGNSAFNNCKAMTKVTLNSGLVSIDSRAFENCDALKSITIPATVTNIGGSAFYYCDELDSITFKGDAPAFGNYPFNGTVTRCYYPKNNSTWTSAVMQDYNGTIFWLKEGEMLSGSAGSRLTWTLDADNVLTISGKGAMPDYNTSSATAAPWYAARKLVDSIVIKSGVTRIGNCGFYNCYNVSSVTIPDTVIRIGNSAFYQCYKLTGITLPDSIEEIGNDAFANCETLKKITIPSSVTKISNYAFYNCDALTTVKIPSSVTSLGYYVFGSCDSLKTATIPGSVTYLDSCVFYDCVNLEEVTLGSGITQIGSSAFYGCTKLEEVSIPKTVEYINSYAFYNCSKLEAITLPSKLKELGSYAFYGCFGLETIKIPANVTTINSYAFAECSNLASIYFLGKAPQIYHEAFMNVYAKAYYTKGDSSWTSDMKQDYGGSLTWKSTSDMNAKPATPTLKATNVTSSGKIKLTWNKVDNAKEYEVYRATSKTGTYKLLKTVTGTSLINTGADAGKTYYYKVCAVSDTGVKSSYSSVVSRTCDLAQPDVTATNVASTGKNKLTWEKVAGATKYEVYRATSKSGTYSKLGSTSGTSYTNTGADAGKTYYYKVKAIHSNSAANSAYSDVVSRTCDLAQPDVTATNVASTGKIKLTWDKVAGATEYEVYRATSKSGTYSKLGSTSGTSYTNTGAEAGKTYYYKVKAIHSNSAANSAYSDVVSRTCDLPRPEVTVKLSSGKAKLTWNEISGAVEYKVYRATSKDGTYKLVKTVTGTSLTNSGLEAGKTYYYKVKAIHSNSAATSAYSSIASIKVK